MDQIKQWIEGRQQDVLTVYALLQKNLSDESGALIHDLIEIEAWYARTGYMLAEANSWLDKASLALMPDKTKEKTEMERRVTLDSNTAFIRSWRDKIEYAHDAIKNRITMGQSLLAYKRQSIENTKSIRMVDKPF